MKYAETPKEVSVFWSSIAAKTAGSIEILSCCVLNDFFTQGYECLPDLCRPFLAPIIHVHVCVLHKGKFGLAPITEFTCITCFTGWPKKIKKCVTAAILKQTYDQKPANFWGAYVNIKFATLAVYIHTVHVHLFTGVHVYTRTRKQVYAGFNIHNCTLAICVKPKMTFKYIQCAIVTHIHVQCTCTCTFVPIHMYMHE